MASDNKPKESEVLSQLIFHIYTFSNCLARIKNPLQNISNRVSDAINHRSLSLSNPSSFPWAEDKRVCDA